MARKTKEEAQATRAAILDAAVRVFSIRGVSRASLADIAREAGVTRGAIYWHFTNKADLHNALWDEVLLPYEPIARASENPDEPDPLGRMRELFVFLFSNLSEDSRRQRLFRILLDKHDGGEEASAIHIRHIQTHVEGFRRIETVLKNAITKGQLPQHLDIRLGAILVISSIDGLVANWLRIPELFDLNSEAPVMVEAMIEMLRSWPKERDD
ncbi:TetR family transcriptional regulator [Desulfobulbus alkaliphilus]|uniref:TetR family transcriptional regulator n=1 Tax=Desulfobulbus alkaliphilus TaxID=869814 RepID=UPI00196485FA|nr:TetR family transcriptional regulator [Desulfobulbus alkaliphilus]MBM9537760.1 TetR family transcriptional regulator [Desulfobulbus alkaliphilus]